MKRFHKFIVLAVVLLTAPNALPINQACAPSSFGKPIANPDSEPFPSGVPSLTIYVLNNDRDQNGGELWVDSVNSFAGGSAAVINAGKAVIFYPQDGATSGSFTYRIRDAQSNYDDALVTLTNESGSASILYECNTNVCTFRVIPTVTSGIKSYKWTFGDNKTVDNWLGSSITHTYPTTANLKYTVNATVYYEDRLPINAQSVEITVKPADVIWRSDHDGDQTSTMGSILKVWIVNHTEVAQNATYALHWDENGDGQTTGEPWVGFDYWTQIAATFTNFYATDGTKTVRFRQCFGTTCYEYPRAIYVANRPPDPYIEAKQVGFTKTYDFVPYSATGSTIHFSTRDEYDATDPVYGPRPYEYDFGDGNRAVGTFRADGHPDIVRHTYEKPGMYYVKLRVTDHRGAVGSTWWPNVYVPDERPTAAFTFSCKGLDCVLDASSSKDDVEVLGYQWSYLGTSASTKTVSVHFPSAGAYQVTLTASDFHGISAPVKRTINVTNAAAPQPSVYYAMTPCRIYDTRPAEIAPLATNSIRVVDIAGKCGIPATGVTAVTANFTAVSPTGPGHMVAFPTGTPTPSNRMLDFTPARTPRAANAIVALGGGKLSLEAYIVAGSPAQTDMIVDVTGYFAGGGLPAPTAAGPFGFQPLEPCRVHDSRTLGGPLPNGTIAYVKARGKCGIPASMNGGDGAAAFNIAAIGPTAQSHMTLFPSTLSAAPGTSVVNARPEYGTVANGAVSLLGSRTSPDDDLAVQYVPATTGNSTHYTLDTTGYFESSAPLRYFPVSQCILAFTADANYGEPVMEANAIRKFIVAGNCGVPKGAKAAIITATAMAAGGEGDLSLFPADSETTDLSTIHYKPEDDRLSNTVIVPLGNNAHDLGVKATAPVHLLLSVSGYFAPADIHGPGAPSVANFTFNCTSWPSCQFDASTSTDDRNSIFEYRWEFGDGSGATTTTPVVNHTYAVNKKQTVRLVVWDGINTSVAAMKVVPENLPPTPYFTINCIGNNCLFDGSGSSDDGSIAKYEWSFLSGQPFVTGSANAAYMYPAPGNYTVQLRVTDDKGLIATTSKTATVVNQSPVGAFVFDCNGNNCLFNASTSTDDYGVASYSWNFGDGQAPSSSTTATISHTFAADQPYDVTLTVTDAQGAQGTKLRRVTPRAAPLASELLFYALPPCRPFDSRLGGRPPLTSGTINTIPIRTLCGVPEEAKAVAVNVTIVTPSEAGYLHLYPTGSTSIPEPTVLNFTPQRSPRGNNFIVTLGNDGALLARVSAGTTGTAHVVIDVTGYFTNTLTGAFPARGPLRFDRRDVVRVFDSRTAPSPLAMGITRYVMLRNASIAGLPLNAEAHALNITAFGPTGTGHFVVNPSDQIPAPTTSALNVQAGTSQANGSLMALGLRANDDLAVMYGSTTGAQTDLAIDSYGWFAKDARYRYYPVLPCRAADTARPELGVGGRIAPNGTRSFQVQGNCGVPRGAKYAVVVAKIVNADTAGTAQIGPIADPSIASIHFPAADIIASTLIVSLSDLAPTNCCSNDLITKITGGGADLRIDVLGYFMPEVNQAPVAVNDSAAAVVGIQTTIDVVANDTDANGDALKLSAAAIVTPPSRGTATRVSDSHITYTATSAGNDSFQYEVTDSRGATARGTVNLTIRATNATPVPKDDTASTTSESSVTIDATANDTDADGDALTLLSTGTPSKGTAQILSNRILYTPNASASGIDTFSYLVGDTYKATATANVIVTITAPNHLPSAGEDSAAVDAGDAVVITPLANDTDSDGDPLKLSDPAITAPPSLGTAVRTNDTTITYTAGTVTGTDVFQYSITDGRGGTARAAITVTVRPTCTAAPGISAQPASKTINAGENATLIVTASGGTKPLVYQWYQGTAPSTATPVGTNSSSLTVTPTATTSYWVKVTNACGSTSSATATVTVCNPPSITTQPASQSIAIGAQATLSVVAGGSGPFSYQWFEGAAGTTTTPVGTNSASFTTPVLTASRSYWVRVTSACNGTATVSSNTATITVTCTAAPAITAQPTSRTINAGQSTTLTVTASEAGSYQWYEGAAGTTTTPVGTNSSSLTVTPSATKSYWVLITNPCGSTSSAAATVTVCTPPSIATQPASQTITAGSTATLTVVAGGSGPFSYQWYEGAAGTTTTPVGTNSASFTTPALSANKSYWVRVTSTCNGTASVNSNTATITVNCATAPSITAQPASSTINAGATKTLTVAASSVGTPSYQWYQGTAPSTTTPIGTNSSSLAVAPAATTSYWVKVTNACGSTNSSTATITVCNPVGIATQPQSKTIAIGTSTTLTVAASGSGPFSYQWYEGASGTTTTPVGTNSASFTTPALTANKSYWVRVTSTCNGTTSVNSNTATITLTCASAPSITAQPTSRAINAGQSTTFTVTANSFGTTTYQWYQGAAPSTATPVGTNSSSLTVTPAATTSYWVNITNACGSTASTTATVTVCTPPSITTHPASKTIISGQTTTLTVAAAGSAPIAYQWFEGASGVTTTPVGTNSATFTTPVLTATKSYWVRVTSTCNGTATVNSTAATVTVVPAQITRRQMNGTAVNSQTSITVTWPQPTLAGNLLVAVISGDKDSAVNWTAPAGWVHAVTNEWNSIKNAIYYIPNNAGGRTTETFTVAVGYHDQTLTLLEYSGVMAASPLDKVALNGDNTHAGYVNTGYTLDTVQPKELVITALTVYKQSSFYGADNGFTEVDERPMFGVTTAVHERITTAKNSWGHGASNDYPSQQWIGVVATFRAADTN